MKMVYNNITRSAEIPSDPNKLNPLQKTGAVLALASVALTGCEMSGSHRAGCGDGATATIGEGSTLHLTTNGEGLKVTNDNETLIASGLTVSPNSEITFTRNEIEYEVENNSSTTPDAREAEIDITRLDGDNSGGNNSTVVIVSGGGGYGNGSGSNHRGGGTGHGK